MDNHKTVSTNHNLSEENGELKQYRSEVLPLTRGLCELVWPSGEALALPLGQTSSHSPLSEF